MLLIVNEIVLKANPSKNKLIKYFSSAHLKSFRVICIRNNGYVYFRRNNK